MNHSAKPRKILITGGAGNVGGSLACQLVQTPTNDVVVVDNLITGSTSKLPPADLPNFRFIKADVNDLTDLSPIMTAHQFDAVFHYAALVGVQRTLANPVAVLRDIDGIRNVLSLAKNTGVERVFYASSSEVYGEPVELPQHEQTTPLNSRLPYAIIKNLGESYFRSYHQEFGLKFNVFRFFNTYGPKQSTDFVVPKFIEAARAGRDITVYGDGLQTRTFCYIDDNLDTTENVLNDESMAGEIINIGSDLEVTVLDLAKTIIEKVGSKSKIVHLPPLPEGDMTRRCPDITKMRKILHRDLTPLSVGLDKML
ncbi:NAD-dependent epimerase/dehydratase family protein [Aporhodopirellula aestuarii]|uniref:NAD-dependent epimerase/dehydratase family protein n=1 Tax=Aporhodopirellula aestuarii TaxID=2950107 RepID=A0ABT0UAT4_9BACT|nr:NAD-dependent epimerase/dehydratase family protein [Aporhodopirellula aestuarii]MCM2373436.1 NAD-dependent epimerase/dehydratase family protein [Aporhodopirellula aestuarii]